MAEERIVTEVEPFLTMSVREGETACEARCMELDVTMGASTREIAIEVLYDLVKWNVLSVVSRVDNGTGDHIDPEQVAFAKKTYDALQNGIQVSQLFKQSY